jgi:hypothetical protein
MAACRRRRLEGRVAHGFTQFQTTQKYQHTLPDTDQKSLDAFSRVADRRIQVIPAPLCCQLAVLRSLVPVVFRGRGVGCSVVGSAGPGSGISEVSMCGCRSAALDLRVAPARDAGLTTSSDPRCRCASPGRVPRLDQVQRLRCDHDARQRDGRPRLTNQAQPLPRRVGVVAQKGWASRPERLGATWSEFSRRAS